MCDRKHGAFQHFINWTLKLAFWVEYRDDLISRDQFTNTIQSISKGRGRVHFNYGALKNLLNQKVLNLYSSEMIINERDFNDV